MMTARRVPLIVFASNGDKDGVIKTIKQGCDVDETNYMGNCAVIVSVKRNDLDILTVLIEANANVEVCDVLGRSALFLAEAMKYDSLAKLIKDTIAKRKENVSIQRDRPTLKKELVFFIPSDDKVSVFHIGEEFNEIKELPNESKSPPEPTPNFPKSK